MGAWIAAGALLLFLVGAGFLVSRRSWLRPDRPAEPWNRQDRLAAGSLFSGVLLGVASLTLPAVLDDDAPRPPAPTSRAPDLQLVSLDVLDHDAENPGPGVDIRLRNVGNEVSVLTSVVFTVEYSGQLQICEAGGTLTSSYSYRAVFPMEPAPGETIAVPISQEVVPNRADRFVTRIGLEPHNHEVGGYVVYVVSVALEHDAEDEPLKIGRAVLVVPLNTQGATAADYAPYLSLDDEFADDFPCYQDNRALLRRAAGEEGAALPRKLVDTRLR